MNFSIFTANAQPAEGRDDANPRTEIALGVGISLIFFVGILGAAALVPLDAATYAPGEIVVEGHRLSLQHREGGVIKKITVEEGQHVNAGDVVVELLGADVQANYRSLSSQFLGLVAERARLRAEEAGAAGIEAPPEFLALSEADRDEAERAMRVQRQQFTTRALALRSHESVLKTQIGELNEQITGYQQQIRAATAQKALVDDDLKSIKELADQGYAPMSQVRSLQRAQADLEGRIGQYEAGVAQSRQQIEETRLQILQLNSQDKEDIAKQLRDINFQLADLVPKLTAAHDQLGRIQIKAPQAGRVVGLTVFREGGVVVPGQRVMDIVPDDKNLVIEAQVNPKDIEGLHAGLSTEVQLGGVRDRSLPILRGTLTQIGADVLRNEKTGAPYFAAEITIPQSQLELARRKKHGDIDLRAGMPAQVVVPTGARTALDFLLEPLSNAIWRSFREK